MTRGGAAINESLQDKYALLLARAGGGAHRAAKSDITHPPD